MKTKTWLSGAAVCMALSCPQAFAATYTLHPDLMSYESAIGGPATFEQDFEGYAALTDMKAVPFLPGVYATSNNANIAVWQGAGDKELFAFEIPNVIRTAGLSTYVFDFVSDYRAVSFDVDGWNPAAPGPALVQILFSDGSNIAVNFFQTGASEDTPVFFGLTSPDVYIRQIVWREGPEVGGSGNEEVAFDNFRLNATLAPVPLPASIWLLGSGLLGLIGIARSGTKA